MPFRPPSVPGGFSENGRVEALHPARESLEILQNIRETQGEYNFAGQYQQSACPAWRRQLVKAGWSQDLTSKMTCRAKFEMVVPELGHCQ